MPQPPAGSVDTSDLGITAQVFITDTVERLQLIPESDVAGKIVFFNRRMQATKDGSEYGIAGKEPWSSAQNAMKKGAIAIVIRPIFAFTQDEYKVFPFSSYRR